MYIYNVYILHTYVIIYIYISLYTLYIYIIHIYIHVVELYQKDFTYNEEAQCTSHATYF